MKPIACGILICALAAFACTKTDPIIPNHVASDDGCIALLPAPVAGNQLAVTVTGIIDNLFLDNHINKNNFRYFRYLHDSLNGADYKIVTLEQYVNNLRIFTGRLVYEFKNGQVSFKEGHTTNGTTLDTIRQLMPAQVRKLFIEDAELFENKGAHYKDTCLKAEFGYYNLRAGNGSHTEQLVKAWRVTCASQTYPVEYPQAYYQDNGKRIVYDNGVRTFE